MITLMVLGWNDVCTPVIQIWPLLLLVADAAASSVFRFMMAQGFELHNQVCWPASFSTTQRAYTSKLSALNAAFLSPPRVLHG